MSRMPASPKLYHITHVKNVRSIVAAGLLLSDAEVRRRGLAIHSVGMSRIKRRRLEQIEVTCHPGTKVGEYVPFYFCPRSVMLYVIRCANHRELTFRGGQEPIVHLEADLYRVLRWADEEGIRWAFSFSNAGSLFAEFSCDVRRFADLDWIAIASLDFRDPEVKERKQAEFLVYRMVPFFLVERIGVSSSTVRGQVEQCLRGLVSPPVVEIRRDWYY